MNLRVLQVEDDQRSADLTRRHLSRHPVVMEVTHVRSTAHARGLLDTERSFQAALIDLGLPGRNGLELLGWIRERALPMAVIFLCEAGDAGAERLALDAGADLCVVKSPDALQSLPSLLVEACRRLGAPPEARWQPRHVLYGQPDEAEARRVAAHLADRLPELRLSTAGDGTELLGRFSDSTAAQTDFDLVLIDHRPPAMGAFDLADRLRTGPGRDLPVVLVVDPSSEAPPPQPPRPRPYEVISRHPGYLDELLPAFETAMHRSAPAPGQRALPSKSERLKHVLETSPIILYALALSGDRVTFTWVSTNITHLMGFTTEEALAPNWWRSHLDPADRDALSDLPEELTSARPVTREYRLLDAQGRIRWIREVMRLTKPPGDAPGEAIGAWHDITEAKRAEHVREARVAVLDGLVNAIPLKRILEAVIEHLEAILPDTRVSILLHNPADGRLYTGAAPRLPAFFNEAVDGLEIGEGKGSCGTAAARGERVVVEDVTTDRLWAPYRAQAVRAGVRACWSVPFTDRGGQVLGTFAIYYAEPRTPSDEDISLIDEFARITELAVERESAAARLRQWAAVLQSTREGVVITDQRRRIVSVNAAYSAITGYAESEVLGRNPAILQSGRHDRAFYRAMWRTIEETGHWQGEIWNRRKNGEIYPQLLAVSAVRDPSGETTHFVGVMTDISRLKATEARLQHLAHHDPLTSLPNRLLLLSRLTHALETARRHDRRVAVMFIDLDRFKNINDTLGHQAGDTLLEAVAGRLRRRLREEDTLGRLGGDEFLLVLEDARRLEDVTHVAAELIDLLDSPFDLAGAQPVYVSASIGVSIFPDDGSTDAELIQHADLALQQAKRSGRGVCCVYSPAMSLAATEQLGLESRLRRAVAERQFVVHYQPQVDISDGRVVGCEALVRWNDPERGLIPPAQFIPAAEETGLIVTLGRQVLGAACAQARGWLDAGLLPAKMSVNLSARQLWQADAVNLIGDVLAESRLPAERVTLEITESVVMGHNATSVATLRALKALGLRLSIDDFGTGYSSLAYLKRFPIDELKIDRSFLQGVPQDTSNTGIAGAIIAMAQNLRLQVVAEGVETEAQRRFLEERNCRVAQGFLFARPLPAADFERWLRERATRAD